MVEGIIKTLLISPVSIPYLVRDRARGRLFPKGRDGKRKLDSRFRGNDGKRKEEETDSSLRSE
jgi:hypothetical protein